MPVLFPAALQLLLKRFKSSPVTDDPHIKLFPGRAFLSLEPGQHGAETQLFTELERFWRIDISYPGRLKIQLKGAVPVDGGQRLRQLRQIIMFAEGCSGAGRSDLIPVLIGVFDGPVGSDDLGGRLFPHAGDPGNIIRGVPHQRLEVDDLGGRYLVLLQHVLRKEILHLAPALLCPGHPHAYAVRGELQQVPVSGNDAHLHTRLRRLQRDRADQVIRLIALQHHQRNIHCAEDLLDKRNLFLKLLGHCFSGPFIFGVDLVAESGRFHVKGDRQVLGLFFIQDPEQDIQEAVDSIGMDPAFPGQERNAVKGPVQYAVSVDQNDLFTHGASLSF